LLIELEEISSNEFCNANVQNSGPGGVFEGEGRAFHCPLMLRDKDGKAARQDRSTLPLP
jgi:hypothetical protein